MRRLVQSEVTQGPSSGEETDPKEETGTAEDEGACRMWEKIWGPRLEECGSAAQDSSPWPHGLSNT